MCASYCDLPHPAGNLGTLPWVFRLRYEFCGQEPPPPSQKKILISFRHKMRFSLHSPGKGNTGVKLDCEILVNLRGLFCLKNRKQTPIPALTLCAPWPGPISSHALWSCPFSLQARAWEAGAQGQMIGLLLGPSSSTEAPLAGWERWRPSPLFLQWILFTHL